MTSHRRGLVRARLQYPEREGFLVTDDQHAAQTDHRCAHSLSPATWRSPTMHPTDSSGKPAPTNRPPTGAHDAAPPTTAEVADDRPLGPHAAQILATEHWSLLAARSLIWNEALNRAAVFLTVLSAAIIALALLADATGFGPQMATVVAALALGYRRPSTADRRGVRGRGGGVPAGLDRADGTATARAGSDA